VTVPRLVRRGQLIWTTLNERLLNISTLDVAQWEEAPGWWRGASTDRSRHPDNHAYGTPDYYYVRRIVTVLRPTPDDVVYDIGSGKGRILCVFARARVRKCVGIELLPDLCALSERNAATLRGRRSPIEVRCEDASSADMSDGTVYVFFNPFGPRTMADVLDNLEASLATHPRSIRFVFYNNTCRDVVEARPWLELYHAFRTWQGLDVHFYRSR
jgi:SAM-dependent methyltransferase